MYVQLYRFSSDCQYYHLNPKSKGLRMNANYGLRKIELFSGAEVVAEYLGKRQYYRAKNIVFFSSYTTFCAIRLLDEQVTFLRLTSKRSTHDLSVAT